MNEAVCYHVCLCHEYVLVLMVCRATEGVILSCSLSNGVEPKLKYSGVVSNWIAFLWGGVKKQESVKNSVGVKQSWLYRVTRYHANRLPLAAIFFCSYFGDPRAMLQVQRALMHSAAECQFTNRQSYQLIKEGQPQDTTHVSTERESEIRNMTLPKFAQEKRNLTVFCVPVFPRATGREGLSRFLYCWYSRGSQ